MKPSRRSLIFLILILLLALTLRLYHLGQREYSTDEQWTLRYSHEILSGDFWKNIGHYTFPPVYFYLVAFLLDVSHDSVYLVRLFLVLMSIFSIYFTYLLGKRLFSDRIALLTSFLLSISLFHLVYSQHMKPYGFLMVLFVLAAFFLYDFIMTRNLVSLLLATLLNIFSFYTHIFSAFFIASQAVAVFAIHLTKKKIRLSPYFISLLVTGVICALWLPIFLQQQAYIASLGGFPTLEKLTLSNLYLLFYPFYKFALMTDVSATLQHFPLIFVLFPILSAVFAYGFWILLTERRLEGIYLLSLFSLPFAFIGLLGFVTPLYSFRYFSYLYPFYLLILTKGFFGIKNRSLRYGLLILTVAIWLFTIWYYYAIFTQPHWNIDIAI